MLHIILAGDISFVSACCIPVRKDDGMNRSLSECVHAVLTLLDSQFCSCLLSHHLTEQKMVIDRMLCCTIVTALSDLMDMV